MKKILAVILLIAILTSCAKSNIKGDSNSLSITESSKQPASDTEITLTPLSGFTGDGIYSMQSLKLNAPDNYIAYTDLSSAMQMPLCGSPECEHATTDCKAVFSTIGRVAYLNDMLLYFSTGVSAGYDGNAMITIQAPSIITCDTMGGNRKVLHTLQNGEAFDIIISITAVSENNSDIYYFVTGASESLKLKRTNLLTGDTADIDVGNLSYSSKILGIYKGCFVVSDAFGTGELYLLNANDGSRVMLETDKIPPEENSEVNSFAYYNNKVYNLVSSTADKKARIYVIDCETGKLTLLYDNIVDDYSEYASSQIYAIYNDILVIDSPQSGDEDKSKPIYRRFSVNLSTGEQKELLSYIREPLKGNLIPINIYDAFGDYLLVCTGIEKYKATILDNGGIPYEIETTSNVISLMSKEDYVSDNLNCREIEISS